MPHVHFGHTPTRHTAVCEAPEDFPTSTQVDELVLEISLSEALDVNIRVERAPMWSTFMLILF